MKIRSKKRRKCAPSGRAAEKETCLQRHADKSGGPPSSEIVCEGVARRRLRAGRLRNFPTARRKKTPLLQKRAALPPRYAPGNIQTAEDATCSAENGPEPARRLHVEESPRSHGILVAEDFRRHLAWRPHRTRGASARGAEARPSGPQALREKCVLVETTQRAAPRSLRFHFSPGRSSVFSTQRC